MAEQFGSFGQAALKFVFGVGNEVTRDDLVGKTLGEALADARLKAGLGYAGNVVGRIQGVDQADALILQRGMTVQINDKACGKAA